MCVSMGMCVGVFTVHGQKRNNFPPSNAQVTGMYCAGLGWAGKGSRGGGDGYMPAGVIAVEMS